MALPVSNVADNEDDLADEFDTTGYVQLPVDHLSDSSSESSHGTTCDASLDSLARSSTAPQTEDLSVPNNAGAVTHINDSTPCRNGGHFTHSGLEGHQALLNGMNGREAIDDSSLYQSGGSVFGMAMEGAAIPSDELHDNSGHVVHLDGMEIHVYGQLAGLQLFSHMDSYLGSKNDGGKGELQDEDVVDESERQRAEDAAFRMAMEADEARRSAPLPQDRCQAIKTAMLNVSLGGFRPEWADRVPEDQWINRLRGKSVSETFSK